jgi:multiple sugar transport system substrate-binding protein
MGKPQGDYDLISYVVMWKTEVRRQEPARAFEPYFANKALADRYDIRT